MFKLQDGISISAFIKEFIIVKSFPGEYGLVLVRSLMKLTFQFGSLLISTVPQPFYYSGKRVERYEKRIGDSISLYLSFPQAQQTDDAKQIQVMQSSSVAIFSKKRRTRKCSRIRDERGIIEPARRTEGLFGAASRRESPRHKTRSTPRALTLGVP